MLAFRFLRSVLRWRRVLSSLFASCLFDAVVGCFLWLLSCPVFAVAWVVRRLCFVFFPCPLWRPVGAPPAWRVPSAGWRCVASPSLASLFRSGAFVWSVRPCLVRRGSGVVLFFWVFVSPSAVRPCHPHSWGV